MFYVFLGIGDGRQDCFETLPPRIEPKEQRSLEQRDTNNEKVIMACVPPIFDRPACGQYVYK